MWLVTLPWPMLAGAFSGLTTIFVVMLRIGYKLHVDAVTAHKERADASERRANAAEARADLAAQQFATLVNGLGTRSAGRSGR